MENKLVEGVEDAIGEVNELEAGLEDEAADGLPVVEELRMLLRSRCIVVGSPAVEDEEELAKR